MGQRAYVLLQTGMGESLEVCLALGPCDWVESVERTTDAYDIIVMDKGKADCEIEDVVRHGLKPICGVVRVVVCPIQPLPLSVPGMTRDVSQETESAHWY